MKKLRVLTGVLVFIAVLAVLSGCGKADISESKYIGNWIGKSVSIIDNDSFDDADDLISRTALEFIDDGTFTGKVSGEDVRGTWEETKEGVKLKGDLKVTAKLEGDELVLNLIGLKLHLVKEEK